MFKCIFVNENVWTPIEISLKCVPKGSINNNPALFQIMAWRRLGDKPLSEPMMVSSLTHICVTRPQWVKRGGKTTDSPISTLSHEKIYWAKISITKYSLVTRVEVTEAQFVNFSFSKVFDLSKSLLNYLNHIDIWQAPCDTCQIQTWYAMANTCFGNAKKIGK